MHGSSKGNQFKRSENGLWYKGDYLGYEGASEYVISNLLKFTNALWFVEYQMCEFKYQDRILKGCVSKDFLADGEELITVEDIIIKCTGSTSERMLALPDIKKRIESVVSIVEKWTGLKNFGEYLTLLLELDALILNEDRHLHNVLVIQCRDGSFRYGPIFDNGAALLSDTSMDYPMPLPVMNAIRKVEAKPFSKSFNKQVQAAEELYGRQMMVATEYSIADLVEGVEEYYGQNVYTRIAKVLEYQLELYKNKFCGPAENLEELHQSMTMLDSIKRLSVDEDVEG